MIRPEFTPDSAPGGTIIPSSRIQFYEGVREIIAGIPPKLFAEARIAWFAFLKDAFPRNNFNLKMEGSVFSDIGPIYPIYSFKRRLVASSEKEEGLSMEVDRIALS